MPPCQAWGTHAALTSPAPPGPSTQVQNHGAIEWFPLEEISKILWLQTPAVSRNTFHLEQVKHRAPSQLGSDISKEGNPTLGVHERQRLHGPFCSRGCSDAISAQKLIRAPARPIPHPVPLFSLPGRAWPSEPRWERRSWKAPWFPAAHSIALTRRQRRGRAVLAVSLCKG